MLSPRRMALCQELLSKMHDYRNFPPSQIEDVRYLPTCLICSLLLSYYLQLNESFKDSSSRQNFPNSLHHTTSHLREDGRIGELQQMCSSPAYIRHRPTNATCSTSLRQRRRREGHDNKMPPTGASDEEMEEFVDGTGFCCRNGRR